ncbi:MAG: translesion DNA synthesis-associated protein ImuA [Betaproteobacteria bacterium]
MSSPSPLLPLEHLHPALWRAHQLGRGRESVQASGYSALDAELPGGGWPQRALTELLLAGTGWGEIRLLAPALAQVAAAARGVLLLGPPAEPCAEALAQLGLDLSRCVVIRGADLLWPLEQALRSGQVGAVVAWAPASLKGEALRRLQLAAQAHEGLAFAARAPAAAAHPGAAAPGARRCRARCAGRAPDQAPRAGAGSAAAAGAAPGAVAVRAGAGAHAAARERVRVVRHRMSPPCSGSASTCRRCRWNPSSPR